MTYHTISIPTKGERFYAVTRPIENELAQLLNSGKYESKSGMLHIFMPHTSCGLTISESFDPSAASDMEDFLKTVAPRNLRFIKHDSEGADDSPSHMKSILLHHTLSIIVDEGKLIMGTWQGIYLAEFRDSSKNRKLLLKFMPDR